MFWTVNYKRVFYKEFELFCVKVQYLIEI